MKKNTYNENYFNQIDTPLKAYFLGFIAGDGNIGINDQGNNFVQINISKVDETITKKILRELCRDKDRQPTNNTLVHPSGKSTIYSRIKITSNKICENLAKYYIGPRKTGLEKFPKHINSKFYRDYIRGFFDADGCISIRKSGQPKIAFSCSNLSFLKDIQEILDCGQIYTGHGKNNKSLEITNLYDICKVGKIMYYSSNCFCLQRKKAKFDLVRKPRLYTAFGETKILTSWFNDNRCVVNRTELMCRIAHTGWNFEKCLTEPKIRAIDLQYSNISLEQWDEKQTQKSAGS